MHRAHRLCDDCIVGRSLAQLVNCYRDFARIVGALFLASIAEALRKMCLGSVLQLKSLLTT